MRTVYLIRHGMPAFPGGETQCIGSGTDLPLSPPGRMQAFLLAQLLPQSLLAGVYHSGAQRAAQTAAFLSDAPTALTDWRELDMGQWEGLTFDEIRRRFPDEYARRGEDPEQFPPPGGETLADAADRAEAALRALLDQSEGDVAMIAHAGINRLLLCRLSGKPLRSFWKIPQPYGCVNILVADGAKVTALRTAMTPPPVRGEIACRDLLQAAGTPPEVIAHCAAVAALARKLCENAQGNSALAYHAALLHDIAKGCPNHAETGAEWLRAAGYEAEAAIVAQHCDLAPDASTEAKLVYLADKLIDGTRRVTLTERFAASLEKCATAEAIAAHKAREAAARRIAEEFHID